MKLSDWTFSVMFHTLLLLVIPVWLADMLLLRVYFLYPTSLQVGVLSFSLQLPMHVLF